jgi:hypothetical protein
VFFDEKSSGIKFLNASSGLLQDVPLILFPVMVHLFLFFNILTDSQTLFLFRSSYSYVLSYQVNLYQLDS